MTALSDEAYQSIQRSLTGFGYRVSLDHVTKETDHLLGGGKPRDVIGMFIESQLRRANLLPKAPELRRADDHAGYER